MDIFPKFIIEGDELILGKVTYHKQLATDVKNVKGGGWFSLKNDNKTIQFFGDSQDFGKATLEDIKKAVLDKKVFRNSFINISDEFTFSYRELDGTIEKLN